MSIFYKIGQFSGIIPITFGHEATQREATRKGGILRKYILIAGSLAAVLLIAFLGGMQLGQAQMYDNLTFGNQNNEVYIRFPNNDDFLIKRYRGEDNRIGIVGVGSMELSADVTTADILEQLQLQLQSVWSTIPGLDNYEIADDELMLFKLEDFDWADILSRVFGVITR